jgi:hypothetical protein
MDNVGRMDACLSALGPAERGACFDVFSDFVADPVIYR